MRDRLQAAWYVLLGRPVMYRIRFYGEIDLDVSERPALLMVDCTGGHARPEPIRAPHYSVEAQGGDVLITTELGA